MYNIHFTQGDCSRGPGNDSESFIRLLKSLSEVLRPRGLLLSTAVSANKIVIDRAYNRQYVPSLMELVDWIGLMTYDYHTGWEQETGHISPLYHHVRDPAPILNANFSVRYWIERGVPVNKIVMGIPTYGSSFTLSETSQNHTSGFRAKASGPGKPGKFTRSAGFLAYYEVSVNLYYKARESLLFINSLTFARRYAIT